jgi:hypothetical protein
MFINRNNNFDLSDKSESSYTNQEILLQREKKSIKLDKFSDKDSSKIS